MFTIITMDSEPKLATCFYDKKLPVRPDSKRLMKPSDYKDVYEGRLKSVEIVWAISIGSIYKILLHVLSPIEVSGRYGVSAYASGYLTTDLYAGQKLKEDKGALYRISDVKKLNVSDFININKTSVSKPGGIKDDWVVIGDEEVGVDSTGRLLLDGLIIVDSSLRGDKKETKEDKSVVDRSPGALNIMFNSIDKSKRDRLYHKYLPLITRMFKMCAEYPEAYNNYYTKYVTMAESEEALTAGIVCLFHLRERLST